MVEKCESAQPFRTLRVSLIGDEGSTGFKMSNWLNNQGVKSLWWSDPLHRFSNNVGAGMRRRLAATRARIAKTCKVSRGPWHQSRFGSCVQTACPLPTLCRTILVDVCRKCREIRNQALSAHCRRRHRPRRRHSLHPLNFL